MELTTPLSAIAGVGPAYAQRLEYLGLHTVEDLLHYYPFRYQDFSHLATIPEVKTGEVITLQGELWSITNAYTRNRRLITKAVFNDGSGTIDLIWFNQPWLIKTLKTGDSLQISGKVERKGNKISIMVPQWEKIDPLQTINDTKHTGRLVPVYSETMGITSKWLRAKIYNLLTLFKSKIEDPLPEEIKDGMDNLSVALEQIHFPTDAASAQRAKERLSFDELFAIQLASTAKRIEWQKKTITQPWVINPQKIDQFIKKIPFELTSAQKKVVEEIKGDLQRTQPMNRLVQGDVGSGKTVVAAIMTYIAHLNGYESFFMAPTEILAFQHHKTLTRLLSPFGLEVALYTGSKKFTKGKDVQKPHVIIGTHALLSDKLQIENIGLVIVDEQQRFGVKQRTLLRSKAKTPHFLTMTATPIPRTVALTLYGDLDLSIINELPKGRKEIKTHFVPHTKRADAYKFIDAQIAKGQQVYIITPLIEESETQASAKAATVEYEHLKTKVFPTKRIGLLHGRLKPKEKEDVLNDFKDHKLDILVSTTVVEVGVDVPNATIMLIEGAERFGLAQLHQLRGRVGRGSEQSYCFLFATEEIPEVISRLKNLETIHDGLKLAELDLKIRGSGEIYGISQSGRWELKIASLTDLEMIEKTKAAAVNILHQSPNLDKYPLIKAKLASLDKEVMPD